MNTFRTLFIATALVATIPVASVAGDCNRSPSVSKHLESINTVLVAGVQRSLKRQGYDIGHVDGVAGPRTMLALEHWRSKNGLPLTGELDAITARVLIQWFE